MTVDDVGILPNHTAQTGFGLLEVLVASLIMALSVVGVLRLHHFQLQQLTQNAQWQRAQWVLNNAQQRFLVQNNLSVADLNQLSTQAIDAGLQGAQVQWLGQSVQLMWQAADAVSAVQRGGCVAAVQQHCWRVAL
jgi:Tfp pilus assembly protein PilV